MSENVLAADGSGDRTVQAACMHWFTLIARPGRAAALVASVGLLFAAQAVLALGGAAAAGYGTLVALVATIVAIGVFAPLHSRSGAIAVVTARIGLALALVPSPARSPPRRPIWLPMLVVPLTLAAGGMAWLVLARRHEGDIPGRLLELALAGTVVGVAVRARRWLRRAGPPWLAVAAALWSSYASPSVAQPGSVTGSVDPLAARVALGALDVVLVGVDGRVEAAEDLALARQLARARCAVSGFQSSERMNAFEQWVKTSSTSTSSPSFGVLPSTASGSSSAASVGEHGAPVDAERVADAGDQEQQPDVRVREDVAQRVGELVAGPLGDEQRSLVEDVDEAGRIAARAHVARAVGGGRREQHERRPLDEPARQLVEAVADLRLDDGRRRADHLAELGLGGDVRRHAVTQTYVCLTAAISLTTDSLASPNSIVVCGSR